MKKFRYFILKNRVFFGIYLIWFVINFSILCIFPEKQQFNPISYYNEYQVHRESRYFHSFYPFDGIEDTEDYDIEEFLFYTIVPLLLFTCFKLFTYKKNE